MRAAGRRTRAKSERSAMKAVILKIPIRRPRRIAGFSAGGFLKTAFAGSTFHLPGSQGKWARS